MSTTPSADIIPLSTPPTRVQALLLAGGLGTRLVPVTLEIPKCMVEIDGRPLFDYWVGAMIDAGIKNARIKTHHMPQTIREKIAAVNLDGRMEITEYYESELAGTAVAISANRDLADNADHVILIYADNLSNVDLNELLQFHIDGAQPITMLLFHAPIPKSSGIATLNASGTICKFIEKPENPESDLANAGVYVLTREAYLEIADMGCTDIGFDVLPKFVGRMKGFVLDGYHRDVGTLESLRQAEEDVQSGLFESPSEAAKSQVG